MAGRSAVGGPFCRRRVLATQATCSYDESVPLSHAQFLENLTRRFAKTFDEDERVAAELKTKLPEAVRLILAALGPRRVTLYGSLATGLFFAASSDVDLAIEGLGMEPPGELASALRALLGRKVDLVDPTLVAAVIRKDIERRGIVLHEP